MAPSLVGCQALPCAEAAGCCLGGPGHEVAGFRILGGPGTSSGSLVGRVRVLKTLGLCPTPWQMKPDPGVNSGLLAGRAGSWSLTAGPRDPRACFSYFVTGAGSRHSWVWSLGCLKDCIGLLVDRTRAQVVPG